MDDLPASPSKNVPSVLATPESGKTDGERKQLVFGELKQVRQSISAFRSPILPPQILAEYNKVIPNAAERILAMAESQQNHRQYLEKAAIDAESRRSDRGLILGFVVVMVLGVGGIYLIANGHSLEGLTGILVPIGALAGTFVYAQRTRKNERLARSQNKSDQAIEKTEGDE